MSDDLYAGGAMDGAYVGKENGWHMKGRTANAAPKEAFEMFGIQPEYRSRLLMPDGSESPWAFVSRTNKQTGKLEIVSEPMRDTWTMITHAEAAELAEIATGGALVETIGVLGEKTGDMLFMNFPLRELDIDGTPMKQYLYYINSLRVGYSSILGIGSVRWVCKNTMELGLASARALYKTPHRAGVMIDTADWIREVWETSGKRADEIVFAARRLQTIPLSVETFEGILKVAMPDMGEAKPTGSVKRDEMAAHDRALYAERMASWRSQIVALYEGAGTGMDLPTTEGMAWGGLNAVCEWLDHYRPAGGKNQKDLVKVGVARTEMAFIGESFRIKNKAAQMLLKLGK
jgi:hypothetical protein